MKPEFDQVAIQKFCRKWGIAEFSFFGSVLREDFGPDSDIDILVSFEPGHGITFDNRPDMLDELRMIFGREVDLVERRALERSPNYIRRKHILSHLEQAYVAR